MSVAEILQGRHLHEFECVVCGPVADRSAAALQIGETLVCWSCLCEITLVGGHDDCPGCWPQACVACGAQLESGRHHRAHVEEVHGGFGRR